MTSKTFHKGKYFVTFRRGFEDYKRDITVTIDKIFETDSLKIYLSDDNDPAFLCILHLTRIDYEDLKKQQGLLIDFDNFPSQLIRLLQQCAANNMFLIMQQTNPVQYYFEVVEHNEFKRLVHLSLKTGPANDVDIKQHMSDTITQLKKTLSSLKSSASSNEMLLNDKIVNMERKIADLTHVVAKIEEDRIKLENEHQESLRHEKEKLAYERVQWQKNSDMNMKTQLITYQDNISQREKQIDELKLFTKQLQDSKSHLENQISEKSQRVNLLETEVQKTHIEVATLKAKNVSLDRDLSEKEKLNNQLNTKIQYLEKVVKDNSDTIKELTSSLHLIKKEKETLEEKIALSESLVNKNNQAVQSTSEQLLKANQIISKQNCDLAEMKEKLLCRTAIALEQEKVIEQNAKEIENLKTKIIQATKNIEKLQEDLDIVKEKYDASEKLLKDRDDTIKNNNMVIQWLHKKVEASSEVCSATPPTSSTPYFLTKRNQSESSARASEDSIDFYATSKLSNTDDTPALTPGQMSPRVGLDPKYLKPALDDKRVPHRKEMGRKSTENQSQGKENVNINLPKVDYREKKSGRVYTQRATPTSAYFP